MSTTAMWLLLAVVVVAIVFGSVLYKRTFTTKELALTGVMAALSLVAYLFFRVPFYGGSSFHLGNTFTALTALLLDGVSGGLAGAIGLALADILAGDPGYAITTFVLKFIIGITCGAVAHKAFKLRELDKHSSGYLVKVIVAAASGLLLNVFTDPFLGYFRNVYIFGQEYTVAQALTKIAGGVTFVNSVASTVCVVVLYLLQKPACPLRVDGLRALAPDGGLIRRILRVGIPAGIENGMFQIGKLSVSSLTSTLGTAAIAANAVANTTTTFLNIPANAVGMAALTVVGQCLGAGEKEQAVYYSRRLLLTAYCGAWVMNLSAFLFANRFAISLFNLSPEAQTMALQVMVWFNFVSLFFWPSSFTLPNILRAAGDARFTMAVSILSMWVFRVGFCYVMVLGFHGRLLSIWMGMFLDWVFRSLCFFVRFARGRWMEQSVI